MTWFAPIQRTEQKKRRAAEFTAELAVNAIRGEQTIALLEADRWITCCNGSRPRTPWAHKPRFKPY